MNNTHLNIKDIKNSRNITVSYLVMNTLCLIFLGVLAITAMVIVWNKEEDSSLSEDLGSSRLVRSADARRRKGKNGRKSRNPYQLKGEHCQYIDFANARFSGSGCVDGTKTMVKNK